MKRAVHVRRARPSGCGEGDRNRVWATLGHGAETSRNPGAYRSPRPTMRHPLTRSTPHDDSTPEPPRPRRRCTRGHRGCRDRRPAPRRTQPATSTTAHRCSAAPTGTSSPASPTASRGALARDVRKAGGAMEWFEQQLRPRRRQRQGRRQGRHLVARAVLLPRQAVAAADHRGPGWLGGDGQLPAPGPAATDPDQPPGAGDDDRVLGEPPQRPGQRRRAVHLPGVVRRPHPRARTGQVLRPAGRSDHPPGDADLPRPGDLHEAAPEREPRPRAARVPHRRPRQLHRGPRQGVGAHPHRLHGRHVGDVAGALQPRGALAGHGQGDGLSRPRTGRRTAATSRAATSSTSRITRRPPGASPTSWP